MPTQIILQFAGQDQPILTSLSGRMVSNMAKKGKSSSYRAHQKTIRDADRFMRQEGEKRRRESGGSGSGGRRGAGRAAEAIVTIVTAANGMTAEPPVDQLYDAADAADKSRSSLVDNRDEHLDEQTRAANDRKGGSSAQ